MIKTNKLSFAFPLCRPLGFEKSHSALQDSLIKDIESWGGNLSFNNEYFLLGSKLIISVYKDPTEYIPFKKYFKPHRVRSYYLLVFKVDGGICETSISKLIDSIPKDEKYRDELIAHYKNDLPITSIFLEIHNFFLVANIAFPGALSTQKGISFIANKKYEEIEGFYAEDLYGALVTAERLKWPKLLRVSILDTWNWLNSSNIIESGLGKNSLGRALAAFSQLTKGSFAENSTLNIIWALLALEAIYTKGNIGLKEQLASKTEVLLGKKEENKKAFGKMYDFRSRLVHGDIDIPLRYSLYDGTLEFENFHMDLYESSHIAIATLIATFQKLIKNNWKGLEFKYSVNCD